jgi:hypothetical protein
MPPPTTAIRKSRVLIFVNRVFGPMRPSEAAIPNPAPPQDRTR